MRTTGRQAALPAAAVLLAVAVAGCASSVQGAAQPAPALATPTDQARPGEPCSLLTEEDTAAIGLADEGEFRAGDDTRRLPPSCSFDASDPDSTDSLDVAYSTTLSLDEHTGGVEPGETKRLGGLDWDHVQDPITGGSVCMLATELSESSFVQVTSSNVSDESKSCELAEAAAPYVAAHLPGGDPAPSPPPTSEKPEPGPLSSADPCTFLEPGQARRLGFGTVTTKLDGTDDGPGGCEWPDTDGDRGVKALDLYAGDVPAEHWKYYGADRQGKDVEARGRTWKLFANEPGDDDITCFATLAYSDTASVVVISGNLTSGKRSCDKVRAALPLVTGNLP